MKTGLVIKELRIKKGLTQEELADKTELSARTIQRIEKGEVDPRAYSLQMIAKALDVDFSLFMEEDESTAEVEKNEKDNFILGMLHLSGLLPLFFPCILIWRFQKNKVKSIRAHFRDVIILQLTIWFMFILPGSALYYFFSLNHIFNKAHYIILIGIVMGGIYSVTNAINVMNNKAHKRFGFTNSKKEGQIS